MAKRTATRTRTRRPPGRPRQEDRPGGSSRAELIAAAATVFAERGYRAATIEEVVRRAGLSKGTFYFTFAGKDDLFLAVVDERIDAPARALMDLTATASADVPTAAKVSAGLADVLRQERSLLLLLHEYRAQAARDERLAERYRRRQAALRATLAHALTERMRHTGVPMAVAAERLAAAFIALAEGLAFEALADPVAVDDELFGEILSLVYDGLVARSRTGARAAN